MVPPVEAPPAGGIPWMIGKCTGHLYILWEIPMEIPLVSIGFL